MSFCLICLEKYNLSNNNKIPKIIKCGDTLCLDCLNYLITHQRKCPICRQNIKEKIEDIRTNLLSLSESEVTWCNICLEKYEGTFNSDLNPKVLKCGDTFCIKCIKNLKKNKNGEICCPICKKKDNENIEEMPINKYIIDLIENEKNIVIKNDINCSKPDYIFSIGLLGDDFVGKTSIVYYLINGKPIKYVLPTIGVDYCSKILLIEGKKVEFQIVDSSGQEAFKNVFLNSFKDVNAAIIIFSLSIIEIGDYSLYNKWNEGNLDKKKKIEEGLKEKTFENIKNWIEDYKRVNKNENKIIFLVGNKMDDITHRIIKPKDVIDFAEHYSLTYFETSALTGENIEKVFHDLGVNLLKQNKLKKELEESIMLNDSKNKKKKNILCV